MATVIAPRPGLGDAGPPQDSLSPLLPERLQRVPGWLWATGGLMGLMVLSGFLRSFYLGGQFWMDEAITTGISLHPLTQIPGILRYDGNPPLYYMLLHIWMSWFGDSERATHTLSLVVGELTIPLGAWTAWRLFGRRTAIMAALLFAFNAWLTEYAQETRMYELVALLGLAATAGFLLGFVYRRRRYLLLFGGALMLMLYTHSWGVFFFVGSAISLIPALIASEERRRLLRDAVLTYVGAGVLFLPWAPTLLFQAANTAAPWSNPPRFGAPILLSRGVLGGDRITMVLIVPAAIGIIPLLARRRRGSLEWTTAWTLLSLIVATLAIAWLESQIHPAFVVRYFAPIIGALLLLIAWGCARARLLGLVAVALAIAFLANPATYAPHYKSNMGQIAAQMSPLLRPGDQVVVGQPEETPLAWYYLPGGLRYANTAGIVSDPSYMNWVRAVQRIRHTSPQATLSTLVGRLRRGQAILFIRPLTEGAQNWQAPWTVMVRRRSAQWGQILTNDVSNGTLKPIAVAPDVYHAACCVANSAVLYQKVR
ncbi:MAG TPA: glycosyltransferase family 39 protein [Solirubrobacteraceae bacterium]|nr:glycosyltransferase family 39 protein [Solirubrobacteraceae bacterium]